MADIRLNSILTPPISTGQPVSAPKTHGSGPAFGEILSREMEESSPLKFSRHAQTRLESRNITLDSGDLDKLNGAVEKAASKGVHDSLVLMKQMAFIVSVPDKTVVTAMPVDETEENVFTNIDGAVIV